jgi:holin-like protein
MNWGKTLLQPLPLRERAAPSQIKEEFDEQAQKCLCLSVSRRAGCGRIPAVTMPRFVHTALRLAAGFAILLVMLWLGNLAAKLVPLPGPLVGMVLLFLFLTIHRGAAAQAVITCGEHFLKHYAFFFIPAGVGVMVHIHQLRGSMLGVIASLVISSLLSLIVTAVTMQLLIKRRRGGTAS